MNLPIRTPPELSGYIKTDTPQLHRWCEQLSKRISAAFSRIENKQIVSVSADKITSGKIMFRSGGSLELTPDSIILTNSTGTQYIKYENDTITIVT